MIDELYGPISTLVVFAVIGLVVYAIVRLARGRRGDELVETDPGIGTVRRLYFYTVSFVSLMMATSGLILVVSWVLESVFGGDVLTPSRRGLAAGVSLAVVGLPIWVFHWRLVQRYVGELPTERRSLIRKLYIYLVLGIAGGVSIVAVVGVLNWLFGTKSFEGPSWAMAIIWLPVWFFHWVGESAEGQPTTETQGIRRLYMYLSSLTGVVMASVGYGLVVHYILLEAYESLFSPAVLATGETGLWGEAMRQSLSVALVGSVVWASHWLYLARGDLGSVLRQAYLYLTSVFGGAVTVLVSLGIMVYWALVWGMGVPLEDDAGSHFRFLPRTLASLSAGAALLAYNWMVLRREAESSPAELRDLRRNVAYLMVTLGLGALVVGIGVLVTNAISILVDSAREPLTDSDFWKNPIALVITLGLLGVPLWGYSWRYAQQLALGPDATERAAHARRIFLFAVLGIGVLALLGSASFLVFVFLRDALEGELSLKVLRDAKIAISIIVAAVVFLPYYWMVYRQDRQLLPADVAPTELYRRKSVTALVERGNERFVRELEAELGYRIGTYLWADEDAWMPVLTEVDFADLARRISDASGSGVLLVPDGRSVRVLSYE